MKQTYLTILAVIFAISLQAQVVYEHISNTAIYDYLDEMAGLKIIELNSIIKPYSRKMIKEKLDIISSKSSENDQLLSKRQKKELEFYLKAYMLEAAPPMEFNRKTTLYNKQKNFALAANPPGLFYKDSLFTLALQPIAGGRYSTNENGGLTETWWGGSLWGYIGKNFGFYSSLRDHNVSRIMIAPEYFVHQSGVPFKNYGDEGIDYSEARGGMMVSWKWGSFGLVKDHVEWGTGYNGTNIQSGRAPSFAMIKLHLKPVRWFEFDYYHGWLVSQVIDSANSYYSNGTYRKVFYPKYMAANMFTFYPVRNLIFSFGNSIVYSDLGGPHAAYMIPFLFYKSVDHTLNATTGGVGQNSQMFFNISSRNIRYLHLYVNLFLDDFSINHFRASDEYNLLSWKFGFRLSDFPLKNLSLIAEYTHTNPVVYQHKIETITYTSNRYNMGHYLRDNSREIYVALLYKPIRGLQVKLAYTLGQHGDDYDYADCANDPDCDLHKLPPLENITWENQTIQLDARYEIVNNTYVFMSFMAGNATGNVNLYTPEYYHGKTNTFSFGANIGF
ncbi:MAG: hypothetical protein V2I62_07655 [Bacteroidales bacterium]|jgi:hypothetical protein|nr:hypothetical protein [Bacteroidales bacterium]